MTPWALACGASVVALAAVAVAVYACRTALRASRQLHDFCAEAVEREGRNEGRWFALDGALRTVAHYATPGLTLPDFYTGSGIDPKPVAGRRPRKGPPP